MKKFSSVLLLSLSALITNAQAEETKPIPLNYNFADQATAAIKSIAPQSADIVSTAYKDLDEDGVQDKLDHCPNTILNVAVDHKGCELDTDLDKVFDRLDHCPDSAPGVTVNRFGCEGDEDNDGVVDSKDQCPGTPEGTPVDEVGCAVIGDADGDGVKDPEDLCPDTPKGAVVNEHGCEPKAIVLTNIVFDTYKHAIRDDQVPILKGDAAALNELKEGEVVLVTGHTDSMGKEAMNLRLSWRRANSTKNFLLEQLDFDPARIHIDGKGELEPITENRTSEGRQLNRRIEIKVIAKDTLPETAKVEIPEAMLKR